MRRVVLLAAALTLAGTGSKAGAQTLRGTIIDEASGSAVSGALVLLLSPDGVEHASAATGTTGAWMIRAPSPGEWSIRVERIGFASTEAGPFRLAATADVTVPLAVSSVPVALPTITVESESGGICHLDPDEGEVVWRLWEEARKALLVSEITRGRTVFETEVSERYTDPFDNTIGRKQTERITTSGHSPFRVPTAEELRDRGYVRDSLDGRLAFYGPDATVLLSDTFQDTHCFHARKGGEGIVGLAFRPSMAPTLPDIRGTLWLDQETAELRTIDFEYAGLRERPDLGIGPEASGLIAYDRLENGGWIVRMWRIRVPIDSTILGGRTYKVYVERSGRVTAAREAERRQRDLRPAPSVYDHGARRDTTNP